MPEGRGDRRWSSSGPHGSREERQQTQAAHKAAGPLPPRRSPRRRRLPPPPGQTQPAGPPLPPRLGGSLPLYLPPGAFGNGARRSLRPSEAGGAAGPKAAPAPPPHPAGRGHGPPALSGTPGPAPLPAAPLPAAVRAEGRRTHHTGRAPGSGLRPPQLRHTGAAAAASASCTRRLRAPPAAASHRPAAAPSAAAAAAAILCVGCLPARCRPPLPAPGPRQAEGEEEPAETAESRAGPCGAKGCRAGELSPPAAAAGAAHCFLPSVPLVSCWIFFFSFVLSLHFLVPSAHAAVAMLRDRGFGSSLCSVRAEEL